MERDTVREEEVLSGTVLRGRILPRSFYNRATVPVSRDLLGKVLVHGDTAGINVET